jgi:uncharacterized protein DUF4389
MTAQIAAYPVRFEVPYPEDAGRLRILVRWFLAIPQILVAEVLGDLAALLAFFAFWLILFTKRYPEPLFNLVVGATRWQYNVTAYVLMHDKPYPPFSFDDGVYPDLSYNVIRQDEYNRWLPLVKWLLLVPHYITLALLGIAAAFVWLYAAIIVVITGQFPRGPFNFLLGVGRWSARVTAYFLLQTDRYPPFSMS